MRRRLTQVDTQVEFGPYKVDVPEGGYDDRFRRNPDLDEVARDPAANNIDFFQRVLNLPTPLKVFDEPGKPG
ncbi:hypothetical protein ACVBGC_22740 [Burkholderia stagnalis]